MGGTLQPVTLNLGYVTVNGFYNLTEKQLKFKGITRKNCIRSILELVFSTTVCTGLMKTCKKNLIMSKSGPISFKNYLRGVSNTPKEIPLAIAQCYW